MWFIPTTWGDFNLLHQREDTAIIDRCICTAVAVVRQFKIINRITIHKIYYKVKQTVQDGSGGILNAPRHFV